MQKDAKNETYLQVIQDIIDDYEDEIQKLHDEIAFYEFKIQILQQHLKKHYYDNTQRTKTT